MARARDYGIAPGVFPAGPLNAIAAQTVESKVGALKRIPDDVLSPVLRHRQRGSHWH